MNTEQGVSGYSLTQCISRAGRTGVWDSLLDFANYTYVPPQSIYTASNVHFFSVGGGSASNSVTTTAYGWYIVSKPSWVTVNPSSGGVGTTNITVTALYNSTGSTRGGAVELKLSTPGTATTSFSVVQYNY
ncbi:BACON domain-containing protein [Candidatus Gracilibacteria bacterium]|nr:BACON domain-containing protein [Candidatus Gracilibacteria bacterium]